MLESTQKTNDEGNLVRQYKMFADMGETEIIAVVSLTRTQAESMVTKHNALVDELESRDIWTLRRIALVELTEA